VFNRDEDQILTWSYDNTARLWDVRTGRQVGPALKHEGYVDGACFSRDESWILTWSSDNTARLWDAHTGSQLGPSFKHDGYVRGAVFTKDESRILTWSADNTARLWDITVDLDFPADQVKNWVRTVTGTELDVDSRQLRNIEPERWRRMKADYERVAAAHARVCKYPRANQWLLFHPQ